jgi:hypothetical protein
MEIAGKVSVNQYNPYESTDENPQKERHNDVVFLDVKRSPLIDFEERCFMFAVDLEAIGGANEAKLVILEHLKHVF